MEVLKDALRAMGARRDFHFTLWYGSHRLIDFRARGVRCFQILALFLGLIRAKVCTTVSFATIDFAMSKEGAHIRLRVRIDTLIQHLSLWYRSANL